MFYNIRNILFSRVKSGINYLSNPTIKDRFFTSTKLNLFNFLHVIQ